MRVLLSKKVHKKLMCVVERTKKNKEVLTPVYLLGADKEGIIKDSLCIRRRLKFGCSYMPGLNASSMHKAANNLINKGLNPVGLARVHHDFVGCGNGDFGTPLRYWNFVMTVSTKLLCVVFTVKDRKLCDGDRKFSEVEVV